MNYGNAMIQNRERGQKELVNLDSLYGHRCRIVVMLDTERGNRERMERDLMISALEMEQSKDKIAKLKSGLRPIVKPSKGRRGYTIDKGEEENARKMNGKSLFFCTDEKISGSDLIRVYFRRGGVEKAFRYLNGDASMMPVRYKLPGRVEAYLSVVSFISYLIISAVIWKMETNKIPLSYRELIEKASKIYEVTMASGTKKIYRWTTIGNEFEKQLKPFNITKLQT